MYLPISSAPMRSLLSPSRLGALLRRFGTFTVLLAFLIGTAGCDSGRDDDGGDPPPPPEEDTTPPAAPASLTGASEDGAIALQWSAPSDDDLAGHRVYRSGSSFSEAGAADLVSSDGLVGGSTYSDDSAENGVTYFYRVAAVDETGNESDLSGMVEKTAFPDPPDEP